MTLANPVAVNPFQELRDGLVVVATDQAYDTARQAWDLAVSQRPAAVAIPESIEEVRAVVLAARGAGLRVAPQSTGHNAAPLAADSMADTVILKLHKMTGVVIDVAKRVAHVAGGTLWRDVVSAAAPHGLVGLHGSAGDVSVAGYVLGGGLSFYGREHGLAANTVVGVEIVTADGSLVRADSSTNPDLFWAVRGGGGNFGVVVALDIALLPISEIVAGMMLWELDRAPDVLRTWAQWSRTAPRAATTSLRLMNFPPLPELPPFLSGRRLVLVDGAVLGSDAEAADILASLRALQPEMDTFRRMPAAELIGVHMDPPRPSPGVSDHSLLDTLDEAAIDRLLAEVGPGTTTPLFFTEIRQLGGALKEAPANSGAVGAIPAEYALFAFAVPRSRDEAETGRVAAAGVINAMSRWANPSRYLNFTAKRVDTGANFPEDVATRLGAVRHRFDPDRLFRANHPL